MWASLSLLAILVVKTHSIRSSESELVDTRFREYNIVPQFLPVSPTNLLTVIFGPYRACLGNILPPSCATTIQALLSGPYPNRNLLYTYIAVDVDAVQLTNNGTRQRLLGLIFNIPGSNVRQGDRVLPYLLPSPFPGTGYHRYILLIYRQPGPIEITTELLISLAANEYRNFDLATFVARYKLGNPIAGNFFQIRQTVYVSQCDDSTYYDSCCGNSCSSQGQCDLQGQCGSSTNQCGTCTNQCGSSTCTNCS